MDTTTTVAAQGQAGGFGAVPAAQAAAHAAAPGADSSPGYERRILIKEKVHGTRRAVGCGHLVIDVCLGAEQTRVVLRWY